MTMRDRILAVIQGRPHDQVPFVIYDGLLPVHEVQAHLGRESVGLLRWSAVHRVLHPHCRFQELDYEVDGTRWRRTWLHTPAGSLYEERAFEPVYDSSSIRKHYIEQPDDYPIFWSFLDDCKIVPDYGRYDSDQAELGELGLPLVAVERTPYQQLWVQWVGLNHLGHHLADCPDHVAHTVALLEKRARRIFEIVRQSPAPFVDFPDNITAPAIGPRRFRQYCVPLYNELADLMAERQVPVYVHMDGNLKPLWQDIAASRILGLDSFAPAPDNDTTVAEAVALWPEKRLWVNFPSSVHLRPAAQVRQEAENILQAAGHTGRLQIQISENVPLFAWRTSLPAIVAAIQAFGQP
jgi:hypothetical protein